MRRLLCALLLLLPAIANATPAITLLFPTDHGFSASKEVVVTVTGTGALAATIAVNAEAPVAMTLVDPNVPGRFHATNLPFVTDDPLTENTTFVIAATDETPAPGSNTATKTFHFSFDDQKPVATIAFVNPPAPDPNTTGFKSLRIMGTMTDNDPNFTPRIFQNGFSLLTDQPATYNQRVGLFGGVNTIVVSPRDRTGNTPDPVVTLVVTRTTVCTDPNFPVGESTGGTTYAVDRFDDLPDPIPEDDVCDVRPSRGGDDGFQVPGLTGCTLRAAIQTANHHPGDDIINLPFGTLKLRWRGLPGDSDGAAGGDLDVTEDLRIRGRGRDFSVIDARLLKDRVFDVKDGVTLQLLGLTVSGGKTPKADDPTDGGGGCVRSQGQVQGNNLALLTCKSDGPGGALLAEAPTDPNSPAGGALTCAIVARSQSKQDGGAIAGEGVPFSLRNSTVSFNSAGLRGGALSMTTGETPRNLVMSNVTASSNKARQAGGVLDLGAGVTAKINSSTFTNNSAKVDSTFSTMDGGQVEIANSILGDKKKPCDPAAAPPLVSKGGNVARDESCLVTPSTGDQRNVDPKLEKLQTNGGPPTHRLLFGSPAIDAAGTGAEACEPLDARDTERGDWPRTPNAPGTDSAFPPFCDAGAFELEVTPQP